jgi:hypothetical protein
VNLLDLGLTTEDEIRFLKGPGSTSKVEGRPMSVNHDGSIACVSGGRLRSIRPEVIEVKKMGPRGGTKWVRLQ